MTAKKTTAKTTKVATEADTQNDVSKVAADATKTTSDATKAITSLFGAYFNAGKNAIEGIVEVDKALLGYAKTSFDGYVALGKETMRAKSLEDVIDLHTAHAHERIEANAANAREVVELTRDKAKLAYAPVKEVIETYRPNKAA